MLPHNAWKPIVYYYWRLYNKANNTEQDENPFIAEAKKEALAKSYTYVWNINIFLDFYYPFQC